MQDRVFINDNQCRLLLKRYACTSTDRNELARYLYSDLEHLLKLLKMHCPVLANLIDYHGKCIPCISTYAALLRDRRGFPVLGARLPNYGAQKEDSCGDTGQWAV